MLPDDVLLSTFGFYVDEATKVNQDATLPKRLVDGWQPLVHVCRRWRALVFGSPRRLNLRLGCSLRTPATDKLDIWPALPLSIYDHRRKRRDGVDNITAILEHSDRVCQIYFIALSGLHLEKVLAAMQVPFPELIFLELHTLEPRLVPDSFLGGSAPHLQLILLRGIPYPALPKLLLSATHLVELCLCDIPHSGYIPPEVMVTALSPLTRLRSLMLEFQSPLSRPDRASRRPPPPTRPVLSALSHFYFKGVGEYLEDIVAHIDVPQIDQLSISFFNQIEFDTPRSIPHIGHIPRFKAFNTARLFFSHDGAGVNLVSQPGMLSVEMPCSQLDWQILSLAQACTSCLPSLSTLEDLYISERPDSFLNWPYNIENTLWLELLRPFTSVKNFYLSGNVAASIVPILEELFGDRTTDVLSTLQNITLLWPWPLGHVQESIEQFAATRRVAGHPIAVSRRDRQWTETMLYTMVDTI
jgi:hypothetical protein